MTDTPFTREQLDQALYNAVRRGDSAVAREAMESGAGYGARDAATGRTLVFAAIDRMAEIPDDSDEFGALTLFVINALGFGADPSARDNDGVSALNYTLQRGNYMVSDLLLGLGADANEKFPQGGDTPMHAGVRLALEGKGIRLLNTLLSVDADPTVKNDAGVSAHDLLGAVAAKPEDLETARAMLSESPHVAALLEAQRTAEQSRLRESAKRFKLGP